VEHRLGTHMAATPVTSTAWVAAAWQLQRSYPPANGNFGLDLNLVPPSQQPAFAENFPRTVSWRMHIVLVPEFEAMMHSHPNFGAINAIDNSGKSIYSRLLLSWVQRTTIHGGVAYTFSKTIAKATGYFNQFDQRSERGPSQLDQPQRFVLNGAWSPVAPA